MRLIQGGLAVAIVARIAALDVYPADRKETLVFLALCAAALGITLYLGRGQK